jgi:thiamine biosynthesis protein ThiS
MTVAELIEHLELAGTRVAVELDRAIVPRAEREQAHVSDGAVVEIVHFVGGGL